MEDLKEELLEAVEKVIEVHKRVFQILSRPPKEWGPDLDRSVLNLAQVRLTMDTIVDRLLNNEDLHVRSFALQNCCKDLKIIEMTIFSDCMHASGVRRKAKDAKEKFMLLMTIAARS